MNRVDHVVRSKVAEGSLLWTPPLLLYQRVFCAKLSTMKVCVLWKEAHLGASPWVTLNRRTLGYYEQGRRIPSASMLAGLCDIYKAEPSFFFTRSKEELLEKLGPHKLEVFSMLSNSYAAREILLREKQPPEYNKPRDRKDYQSRRHAWLTSKTPATTSSQEAYPLPLKDNSQQT